MSIFPETLKGTKYHLIGIKGTGMTAMAQYLHKSGAEITGSDTKETFYTDEILKSEGIVFKEGFSKANIPRKCDAVIYSAAYSPDTNDELAWAFELGLPTVVYPQALGELSLNKFCIGVAGVHGKTTTTAMIGTIVQRLGLPGAVIVGSGVRNFKGSQVLHLGNDFLVAETCEYRRHFLHFSPDILIVTSIEADHLDYFKDYQDILNAFIEYADKLPGNGVLVYCDEDKGACELADWAKANRPDVRLLPYGSKETSSEWTVADEKIQNGRLEFKLKCFSDRIFSIKTPGHHSVMNAAASLASVAMLIRKRYGKPYIAYSSEFIEGLAAFDGTNRRSEVLFENKDYLIMDDYAHHPTALRTTLRGLKALYPDRRLVVSFMSHTYSRTNSLFNDFVDSLTEADMVFLHKIYPSAREVKQPDSVEGIDIYNRLRAKGQECEYIDEPEEAVVPVLDILKPGDIFITLGAGNNWIISHEIAKKMETGTI